MQDKTLLRASVVSGRAARPASRRELDEHALAAGGIALCEQALVVAGYAGVGTEPPTRALLDALLAVGKRVVLPVVAGDQLTWGDYSGWDVLAEVGRLRLRQPQPSESAADAASRCDLALVPALAVDRAGHRLGKGAGFYDRWLGVVAVGRRFAVVFDDEVVDEVPHEAHDVPVAGALTPGGVIHFPIDLPRPPVE